MKSSILESLKETLLDLRSSSDLSYRADISQLIKTPSITRNLKRELKSGGVVIITGGVSHRSLEVAKSHIIDTIFSDFGHLFPKEITRGSFSDPFELDVFRSSKCGRGNASFGFLFRQPDTWNREKIPSLTYSCGQTAMYKNSAYYNCNIKLISHPDNENLLAALFSITNKEGCISIDSTKCCDFKTRPRTLESGKYTATKRVWTQAHIDKYISRDVDSKSTNRAQAMIFGEEEGDVTLCFVRFGNNPKVQKLISEYLDNPSLFDEKQGFFRCHDIDLLAVFKEAGVIVVPRPTDLVIWDSGVIHVELHRDTQSTCGARDFKAGKSLRYIVGTHIPVNLTDRDLKLQAIAAKRGYIPHPYIKGPPKLYDNVFYRKTTMYKKCAPTCETEAEAVLSIAQLSESQLSKEWKDLSPSEKFCFGDRTGISFLTASAIAIYNSS